MDPYTAAKIMFAIMVVTMAIAFLLLSKVDNKLDDLDRIRTERKRKK